VTLSPLNSELRRRLLQVVGAFFLLPVAGLAPASVAAPLPTPLERASLAAFLDVLLPRDAFSGSASDLGVDRTLWAFARTNEQFLRLLGVGCQWLNLSGRGGFSALPASQQIAVVQWMSTSDWNQVPRRFYELLRQAALETYYSQPAAWAGLALQPAPQPVGYPPPWP
jgi:hypothetical protein